MNDQTDQELLRDYAERQSEAAFAVLVQRYVDLVYSAAFRMVCDAHAAKDVTQAVFVALAQNARQLTDRPALAGWLHGTARNLAVKAIRSDVRRRAREQESVVMNELLSAHLDAGWEHIAPYLDDALGELSEPDRDAVLLRYFKNHDLRTVGATLGISDDAAQKRVSRAVERLREFFAKRGVTVGASGLAVVISANAVQAAPVGLALTISTAAALTGTTLATTATVTATKAIAMTALQKTIVTATIAVLAGAGIYEARQASQLREQVQMRQQQQSPLIEQVQQLNQALADATNQLATLREDNERLNRNTAELLKLRSEVARLRSDSQELVRLKNGNTGDAIMESTMKSWLARVDGLKKRLEQTPGATIPEMQYLTTQDWLDVTKVEFKTDEDYRKALAVLRMEAATKFGCIVNPALVDYSRANNGQFPTELSQLTAFFKSPVDTAILDRYQIIPAIYLSNGSANSPTIGEWAITQKSAVDEKEDVRISIGLNGIERSYRTETDRALDSAINAFAAANNGRLPTGIFDLKPYLSPSEQEAFQKRIRYDPNNRSPTSVPARP